MHSIIENSSWFRGSNAIGLHIQFSAFENQYFLCHLKNEKGKITLQNSIYSVKEFPEQLAIAYKNYPLYLSIDGKGVMHLELKEGEEVNSALNRLLPNAKPSDFYLQEFHSVHGRWLSLIRMDLLVDTILNLATHNSIPFAITLGAFPVENYIRVTDSKLLQFDFQIIDQNWSFNAEGLFKIEKGDPKTEFQNISLGEDSVLEVRYLLPYTNALNFFLQEEQFENSQPPAVIKNRNAFFQQRLFKIGGWASLIFFFSLLLLNFLLFDYYQKEVMILEAELSQKQQLIDKLENIKSKIEQKKTFFEASGLIKPAKLSYKADRIAAEVPKGISLSKLAINPIKKNNYQPNEEPEFSIGRIQIEGLVGQSTDLNSWIKKMKKKDWIVDVEVESYEFLKKENVGSFILVVTTD